MDLDLQGVGPPSRGLFLIGKNPEIKVRTENEEAAEKSPTAVRPEVGKVSLNPYVDALQTMDKLERARKILSPYLPAESRKILGSHIDRRG